MILNRSIAAIEKLLKNNFIRFCMVGGIVTVIDLSLVIAMVEIYVVDPVAASAMSFIVAASISFLLNKIWTFKNGSKRFLWQFLKFFVVASVGLSLNIVLMKLLISFGVFYVIAKLFVIIIIVFWNYSVNKYWTFKSLDVVVSS